MASHAPTLPFRLLYQSFWLIRAYPMAMLQHAWVWVDEEFGGVKVKVEMVLDVLGIKAKEKGCTV